MNDSPAVTTDRATANQAMVRCANGEDAAFAAVYAYVAPPLRRSLLRKTRHVQRTEDLLQQATLQMYRYRTSFDPGRDVLCWAFGVVRNLWLDEVRRHRRAPVFVESADEHLGDDSLDPDGEYVARELAVRLARVLSALPKSQRTAFELLRVEGLSHEEAATRLGVTVPAVKLRAHRAYGALRRALTEPSGQVDAAPSRQVDAQLSERIDAHTGRLRTSPSRVSLGSDLTSRG